MQKDPVFHSKYSAVVGKNRAEGASRQVPDDELASNRSGTFLTTLYGIQENQKNPG